MVFEKLRQKSNIIKKAYDLAQKAHQGQKRKNGEPYFNHSLATAKTLTEWNLDEQTIAAGLLHDVVEDTPVTIEEIKKQLGEEIAFLVDGVTKIGKIRYRGIETRIENLRKFILYLSQDIRVILIKLADRLHNMRTLAVLPLQKQKRIALETMEIYAPLAYRLGMQRLSGELEDLAFPYIYPKEYQWLRKTVKDRYEKREKYAEKLKPIIEKELKNNGVQIIKIDSRAKRYSSLYKKLLRYDMDIEQIHDLVALRIIVKTIEDCYNALGLIHKMWPPLPGRIKDYIALPKSNGYRSLHTTVFIPENKTAEIQIKTEQMHQEAEYGIAAHFAYHEAKTTKNYLEKQAIFADKKELAWIQQLRNWQKEFTNSEEFLQTLKIDFFRDRILALTPQGEVIDLPLGATPVDFAYQIHSGVGDSCIGAKINGRIYPLDAPLKSGNVVEIITQKGKKPSESWLKFVKTSQAKNRIKSALRLKNGRLKKMEPTQTQLKIIARDKMGLIKDISSKILRCNIKILNFNTQQNGKFQTFKINLSFADKEKAEKLIVKLKQIKEIEEIGYRLV
jgi:GTP pyrophosphokinase